MSKITKTLQGGMLIPTGFHRQWQKRNGSVSNRPMVENLECRVLMTRVLGIDVSNYQGGSINWSTVKNTDGIGFAWAKATEGVGYTDPDFTTNMTNAAAAGEPIGGYDFAHYDTHQGTSGADTEAAYYWGVIKPYITNTKKYLMPMLDVEDEVYSGTSYSPGYYGYTQTTLSQWVNEWCNDIVADAAGIGVTVTPVIYTGSSFAATWMNSTLAQSWPIWLANYNGESASTGTPSYNGGYTPWSTWQFWQYNDTGTAPGDQDVLNGNSSVLQDYIIGTGGQFASGSAVQTTASVKAYATSASNTTYTTIASGSVGTIVAGPVYGNSYQRWEVKFSSTVTGWVEEDLLASAPVPAAVTNPSPINNGKLTTAPTTLSWTASASASSYSVTINGTTQTTTSTIYSLGTLADGVYPWTVNAINSAGSTPANFTFTLDTTPPTATFDTATPTAGSSSFQFGVTYADATSGVSTSSIGAGDVTVSGPNSYSQSASFVSYNSTSGLATYQITAPNNIWDASANGTYTVSQVASQVDDNFGNFRPAGTLGTFAFNTFAYVSSGTLVIQFGAGPGTISLSQSGANLQVQKGSSSQLFATSSFTAITVEGGSGADALVLNDSGGALIPSGGLQFTGGSVSNSLTVTGPSGSNPVTVSSSSFNIGSSDISLSGIQSLIFNPGSGTDALDFSTAVSLPTPVASSGITTLNFSSIMLETGGSLVVPSLVSAGIFDSADKDLLVTSTLTNNGLLDLNGNALIVHNGDQAELTNEISSGFNAASGVIWSGTSGITSSLAGTRTSVGLGIETQGSALTSFEGPSLASGDVVITYTYLGDADLDGAVTSSDYTLIDSGFNNNLTGWHNGDFNYDGVINGDDYTLIDAAYNSQGSPLIPNVASPTALVAASNISAIATLSVKPTVRPATATVTAVATPFSTVPIAQSFDSGDDLPLSKLWSGLSQEQYIG